MTDRNPLKFEFDDTTPSSLAEFTSSDTVSIVNGGTGVSSLSLWPSVSSTSVSATSFIGGTFTGTNVSATAVSGVTVDCAGLTAATASISWVSSTVLISPAITGTTVSSTTLTSPTITGASVSATAVSGLTINGLPYPAPYAYVRFTTAGTPNDAEQNIGIGCSKAEDISSADDFAWDDTNKRFEVVNAGTYEFTVNAVLMVDATTTITLQLYATYPGSSKMTADTRVHSSIDADIVTLTYVGAFTPSSYAFVTTTDDGATDVTIYPGTSMLIKRLK